MCELGSAPRASRACSACKPGFPSPCRVLLPDGTAGKRLGLWLREHGFDRRPLPPPKRKREAATASGGGGLVRYASSEPGSPSQQQQQSVISPSKSGKLDSMPGSASCCPHCRCPTHGGGGLGLSGRAASLPAGRNGGGGVSSSHSQSQCSGASVHHSQSQGAGQVHARPVRHHSMGQSAQEADSIKRSLEAFLASLPPSAQAALGSAVGSGSRYASQHPAPAWAPYLAPRHHRPSQPAWQQQVRGPRHTGQAAITAAVESLRWLRGAGICAHAAMES